MKKAKVPRARLIWAWYRPVRTWRERCGDVLAWLWFISVVGFFGSVYVAGFLLDCGERDRFKMAGVFVVSALILGMSLAICEKKE